MNKIAVRLTSIIVLLLAIAYLLYQIRPIGFIHGTAMFLYTWPLMTTALLVGLVGSIVYGIGSDRGYYSRANATTATGVLILGVAIVVFIISFAQSGINKSAFYNHNKYEKIETLPAGGVVRLMPKQVANQIANNNFSSSTETLRNSHIVREGDGKLYWTYEQAPNGVWRSLTKQTQGAVGISASEINGDTTNYDAPSKIGPSMRYSDGIRWQVYKRHFFSEVTEIFVIPDGDSVVYAAPYIKYKGVFAKRPYFAGVVLVYPNGKIKDLSPAEAAKNSQLRESGRLYPEKLARYAHDAYAYNGGIFNKWFGKENVTNIVDPDAGNSQPYLLAFGDELKWVSVAEPASKEGAVKAIFITDAVTGKSKIWNVSKSQSFAGPSRALDAAAGRNYEGIVFGKGRGKFKAVEPRPVFFNNKLHYLISIIPATKTEVTKSVIVDANKNRVVHVFHHDTHRDAVDNLMKALSTGDLPEQADEDGSAAALSLPEGATLTEQIEALIAEDKKAQAEAATRTQKLETLLRQLQESN